MKKMNLKDLKVESFITGQNKVKGGFTDPAQCGATVTARPTMCTNLQNYCFQDC